MVPSVLFISKINDFFCECGQKFIRQNFPDNLILLGQRTVRFPEQAVRWKGDYIISYLSPWIIPDNLLKRARIACINFHPGPPEYPGIGCTNFAIYNKEKIFGITCHHMNAKVDTGKIIAVKRFPLFESDTVFSLTQRCYSHILSMFYEIVSLVLQNGSLPECEEIWKRKPYTRKELNELCRVESDMGIEEIRRRVKAVSFPNAPGA